ncbi:MAG: DUF4386 family protein [Acidobacteriota bacterium]
MGTLKTGRVIGALVLLQMAGLSVGFILLKPGVGTDYLAQAAGMEGAIRIAVIVLFASALIALGTGIAAFPVLREHGVRTAIWLVAIGTIWVVLQSMDGAHIFSMMSLSERHAEAGGANADLYNIVGAQVRSTRIWVHYGVLLTIDLWFGLFYGALLAFRLVPGLLGAFGVLAVVLHLIGIPLAMFIGYPTIWPLAYGLGISFLLIGGWLIAKGFAEKVDGRR